jgi:glycosyltransferase involved in cell wall biosynthesis
MSSLLVIIPDHLSDLIAKGEMTPRYYNPGNLFNDVHVLLTNDDAPNASLAQSLVGSAKLTFHNLPSGGRRLFAKTLGWRPPLLRSWAAPAVELAKRIRPSLIRCHGNGLNAFAALSIKRALGIPYVISLHGNPDVDYFRGRLARTWQQKLIGQAIETVEILTVQNADMVLPVYSPIVPYLQKHGVTRYQVTYNAVGYDVVPKKSYDIPAGGARLLCVGRQQRNQKDPSNIIRAVASIPNARLTLIGDGDLHEPLKDLSASLKINDRVNFIKAMPNKMILAEMARSDLFVYHSDNWEISKGCLEAGLTGLPVILNDRDDDPAEEIESSPFVLVRDSAEGYRWAIEHLLTRNELRKYVGTKTLEHSRATWAPETMERKVVEIYQNLHSAARVVVPDGPTELFGASR